MPEGAVWIDGVLAPAGEARISVFDRGFLYGDSAFEVMRTYDKRPFREAAHLDRLRRSCERLLISLTLSSPRLSEIIASAISASRLRLGGRPKSATPSDPQATSASAAR